MKKKRIMSMLLTGLLIVSLLSACRQKPASSRKVPSKAQEPTASGSSAEETNVQAGEEKGLQPYKEPITVSLFAKVDSTMNFKDGESMEDNLWTRLCKDKLNINVDYKWVVTDDQYNQKMSIAIASKAFADIMNFGASDKNFKLMYDAGYLTDLTSLYDEYASKYTKSLLEADDGTAINGGTFDGNLVGIPNTNASVEQSNVLWIRTDWLERSGKSAPKTMEELYDLAKIFQSADYDGVGTIYGISMDKGSETNAVSSVPGIFTGFGAYPTRWVEKDGKLVYGSTQPENKKALSYLAKLYSEGLIDKEYGVKDGAKVGEDACSGKIGLYIGGHASPLWPLNATVNEKADWTPYPMPSVSGKPPIQIVGSAASSYYVANKDCEHPEALFKLMNLFTKICFSDEGDPLYFITSEEYREPFKLAPVQAWPMTKNIDVYKRIKEYRDTKDESIINANEETRQMFSFCKKYDETGVREGGWDYKRVFDVGGSEAVLSDYLDHGEIQYDRFYGVPTDTMSSKLSSLQKLEAETFSQIIMGASSVDEFDKFVSEWNKLGGSKITDEVNDWAKSK
jgi:putative aldouronate transport system substrate-binding protein